MSRSALPAIPGDIATFRARLRDEFHIRSMLIAVPTLAQLIGVSPSTLYAYIRDDTFFLPYRRVNKTPMVAVDDFIEWYCAGGGKNQLPQQ